MGGLRGAVGESGLRKGQQPWLCADDGGVRVVFEPGHGVQCRGAGALRDPDAGGGGYRDDFAQARHGRRRHGSGVSAVHPDPVGRVLPGERAGGAVCGSCVGGGV